MLLGQPAAGYADGRQAVGARSRGMADAAAAQSDAFSVFNNIAGIAAIPEGALLSSYHSLFGFEGLGTSAFGVVMPLSSSSAWGAGFTHFGDRHLSQVTAAAGAAHKVDRFSMGFRLSYLQLAGTSATLTFSRKALVSEIGGIWSIRPGLSLGAQVYNLTQSRFSRSGQAPEKVPTVLKAGLAYKPSEAVQLLADVVADSGYPVALRCGIQLEPAENLFLRTGIASAPRTLHFGVGYTGGPFAFDYAMHTHTMLGNSHHFSLLYYFRKTGKAGNDRKFP